MVAAITGGEDEGVISFPMQDESKDLSTPWQRFVTAGNPAPQPSGIGCLLLTGTGKGRRSSPFLQISLRKEIGDEKEYSHGAMSWYSSGDSKCCLGRLHRFGRFYQFFCDR
jgi:hypothetical protein